MLVVLYCYSSKRYMFDDTFVVNNSNLVFFTLLLLVAPGLPPLSVLLQPLDIIWVLADPGALMLEPKWHGVCLALLPPPPPPNGWVG